MRAIAKEGMHLDALSGITVSLFDGFSIELGWITVFGGIIVLLLVIPQIIFLIKFRNRKRRRVPEAVPIIEKGLWGLCCVLTIMNASFFKYGFDSTTLFIIYLLGNLVLLLIYYITWISFFVKPSFGKRVTVAVVAVLVFCLSGVTLTDIYLIVAASLFGTCHIFLVSQDEYE